VNRLYHNRSIPYTHTWDKLCRFHHHMCRSSFPRTYGKYAQGSNWTIMLVLLLDHSLGSYLIRSQPFISFSLTILISSCYFIDALLGNWSIRMKSLITSIKITARFLAASCPYFAVRAISTTISGFNCRQSYTCLSRLDICFSNGTILSSRATVATSLRGVVNCSVSAGLSSI
jgi:hypothetical protein